jgi:hypothetical protein
MDQQAEHQRVIKYAERELRKIKKARDEDPEAEVDTTAINGRITLLRGVIKDRQRLLQVTKAKDN